MSLSAEASILELSLGPYWEPTLEENTEAAEISGLQVGLVMLLFFVQT
jgi:hypothetical protein